MTDETIKIERVTPKESKAGKVYYSVNGKYTVHEKDIARTFEDNIGKAYKVRVMESEDGKWKNIRAIIGPAELDDVESIEVVRPGRDRDMTSRRSALINAIEYTKKVSNNGERDSKILDLAEEFYSWLVE